MKTSKTKILKPISLARKLVSRSFKKKYKRLVFTNGCFDLLHEGHVSYLEAARAKGDCLIVAIDDDASVSALKGPQRPINTLGARMRVIAGLGCVDFVTHFGGGDPVPLIKRLKPHVLVKGGDWVVSQIKGYKEVKEWGGHVFSIRFVPGRSTTNIVQKIRTGV